MTRTDGEHELVLGNKQLLSAFFVVVILLGVFFTMGYFVGKNTATAGFNAGQAAAAGARPDAAGRALDVASTSGTSPAPDSTTAAADPSGFAPSTQPAAAPPPPTAAPSETSSESKPAHRAPPPEARPANTETMAQPSSEEMYLQVSAVRRPDADNMVKVLRERGFAALLGESSKQGLFRVLVGPFKTNTEMGHAKSELKAKGFDSIVAK